jgi:hypothetical protein
MLWALLRAPPTQPPRPPHPSQTNSNHPQPTPTARYGVHCHGLDLSVNAIMLALERASERPGADVTFEVRSWWLGSWGSWGRWGGWERPGADVTSEVRAPLKAGRPGGWGGWGGLQRPGTDAASGGLRWWSGGPRNPAPGTFFSRHPRTAASPAWSAVS